MTDQQMPLAEFLRTFSPVSDHTWQDERAWLEEHHPRRLGRIRRLIAAEGIEDPVRVCWTTHVVIDGHHRVIAAEDLGLDTVPVADAWEAGMDWAYYADDNSGDDPVRPPRPNPAPRHQT